MRKMSHAENAEYAEAFQTRSAWGADRWVYNRAGTVPRDEDFGVEWFRTVVFSGRVWEACKIFLCSGV